MAPTDANTRHEKTARDGKRQVATAGDEKRQTRRARSSQLRCYRKTAAQRLPLIVEQEEAQAVLFPTSYLTSPADAAPTTAELIAQATEMIGCGREDSNLHECYLTRSLADLADQKANEFKGASRSGTPENTLARSHFSPVVKNRARDLLRTVANGGDVSIARVHDFARAVIEAPPFQLAQEILQDASPEFAIRRALELASMVLSADDGAGESVSQRCGAMKMDRSGTLAR